MEERRSDTEETYGGQDPPGAVSNQNGEVGEAGHEDEGSGADRRKRHPQDDDNPGGAGEESQATGHPDNAG